MEIEMYLVSVIIPCYNQGQYLDEAVNSVLDQTYQNFEIIIINDGSTDEFTIELLQSYNKPKTTILHTDNQGLPAARNYGINHSNGEFILPLDADDILHPQFIEKTLNYMMTKHDVKAVSSYVQEFGISSLKIQPQGGTVDNFLLHNQTCVTAIFRKKDFYSAGMYDESMTGYADWEFWIRFLSNGGRVAIVPEYLFFYRKKSKSMFVQSLKNNDQIYEYIIDKNIDIYRSYTKEMFMDNFNTFVYGHYNIAINNLISDILRVNRSIQFSLLLYGVGEIGTIFYRCALINGINVTSFLDSNPDDKRLAPDGKMPLTPERGLSLFPDADIVIASRQFVNEMLHNVLQFDFNHRKIWVV